MNLANIYSKFRGSKWFLIGLIVFVLAWLAAHFIFSIDQEFGMLNLFLSTEASISLAFFTMLGDQQSAEQKQQTKAIEQILLTMQKQDEKLLEVVEDIKEEIDGPDESVLHDL